MNWVKLYSDLQEFAERHGISFEEPSTSSGRGRLTTYQLAENETLYYQIKHSKPIAEYGSKIKLYSIVNREVMIEKKTGLFGKPKLSIEGAIKEETQRLIQELPLEMNKFRWEIKQGHLGWPDQLLGRKLLVFESSQIESAVSSLEKIREIHLQLLK